MPEDYPNASSNEVTPEEFAHLEVLQGVKFSSVSEMLRNCPILELQKDEVLMSSGELQGTMYLVLSGRLRVHLDGPQSDPVAYIESGHTVGELSVLDESPSSAWVIAEEPSRLVGITEVAFWRMVNVSHDFSINLLLLLAQRLRATNFVLSEKLQQKREHQRKYFVDATTGLYNRRWLEETLPRFVSRHHISKQPLSLLLLEIDSSENPEEAAQRISRCLRNSDLGARYGSNPFQMETGERSERFCIVLPDTNQHGAELAANRLYQSMNHPSAPSLVIGGTTLQPAQTHLQLLALAENALILAKLMPPSATESRKNRISFGENNQRDSSESLK